MAPFLETARAYTPVAQEPWTAHPIFIVRPQAEAFGGLPSGLRRGPLSGISPRWPNLRHPGVLIIRSMWAVKGSFNRRSENQDKI